MMAAFFKNQVGAETRRQNVFEQIRFVDFVPDTRCDGDTLFFIEIGITVEVGRGILKCGFP